MTTDERLDRLTERHQALAESLQLLTADVQSMATKHGALAESLQLLTADVQSLAQSVKEHDRFLKEHDRFLKDHDRILRGHADLIGDLARIATAHEQRIQGLEGRQS
ncbi:MAG TPA: hypothetical protein VEH47_04770 [Candidatus Acidoferrales bacterium]|nr:hypothetical protein [Candidatus Acidoferrales bacterium]